MCTIGKSNPRAQGVYLAQDFSRMGTARMKQEERQPQSDDLNKTEAIN